MSTSFLRQTKRALSMMYETLVNLIVVPKWNNYDLKSKWVLLKHHFHNLAQNMFIYSASFFFVSLAFNSEL